MRPGGIGALRGAWHRLRGSAPIPAAPGWRLRVDPASYLEVRYWLRYEAGTFAALRRLWRPDQAVLDIGAHRGEFCLAWLPRGKPPGRLLAVEPSPAARAQLQRNLDLHAAAHPRVADCALGDHVGTVELHAGPEDMLLTVGGGETLTLPLRTADDLCREFGFRPDVVKIDVEGYEGEVLRGAREVLARRPVLFLEWHRSLLAARGLDPLAALAAARGLDYAWFDSGSDPAIAVTDWGQARPGTVRLVGVPPGRSLT